MMKIGDVTVFKMPADKTEADITIKQLIDDGFEKDKSGLEIGFPFSMPTEEANMCFTEA